MPPPDRWLAQLTALPAPIRVRLERLAAALGVTPRDALVWIVARELPRFERQIRAATSRPDRPQRSRSVRRAGRDRRR